MAVTISIVTDADLQAVDKLMKMNSNTLGFLPKQALEYHIKRGWMLGAKTADGRLVGYLLFASYYDYIRVIHLCVAKDYRGQGVARSLMERLKETATTQKRIQLRCRRDFPENNMWPKFGFIAVGETPGRSVERYPLTAWCFTLKPDDQLTLFQAKVTDDRLDAIIDAQVFFDLEEPDTDKARPSQALTSDFLIDSLRLFMTDEIFNEIERNDDRVQRQYSREQAHQFHIVTPDPKHIEKYDSILRSLLSEVSRPSDESDIRHLAKAAASDVNVFVTRDRKLLERADELSATLQLQVLTPTNLILKLHKLSAQEEYTPDTVSGPGLAWRRLTSTDLRSISFQPFLLHRERQGAFATRLESLIAADPDNCWCELLWSDQTVLALRVVRKASNDELIMQLARVAPCNNQELIERFTISDAIEKAVDGNLNAVRISAEALSPDLGSHIRELGFISDGTDFVRYCFSQCLDANRTLALISHSSSQKIDEYRRASPIELERLCSPLCMRDTEQNHFLIPIRPGYALSLVDRRRSASDMFGGEPSVLLRWDNVYYKTKDRHRMLKPPARILWYVSGSAGQVVAVSHLDGVEIGTPSDLLKRFEKRGIFRWREIFETCGGDPSREIMALEFSHTFAFRKPVSLASLRTASYEEQHSLVVQSASRIPRSLFEKIYLLGYAQ